jgi:hypothetical protein
MFALALAGSLRVPLRPFRRLCKARQQPPQVADHRRYPSGGVWANLEGRRRRLTWRIRMGRNLSRAPSRAAGTAMRSMLEDCSSSSLRVSNATRGAAEIMQGRSRWNIRVPNRCQAAVVPAGLLVACNSVACLAEMGKKRNVSYTNHRASSEHAWGTRLQPTPIQPHRHDGGESYQDQRCLQGPSKIDDGVAYRAHDLGAVMNKSSVLPPAHHVARGGAVLLCDLGPMAQPLGDRVWGQAHLWVVSHTRPMDITGDNGKSQVWGKALRTA